MATKSVWKGAAVLILLATLPLFLSACFLRSLTGNVTGEAGDFEAKVGGNSLSSTCRVSISPRNEGQVTCYYIIDWDPSFELESTADIVAEFGLFGVIVDPLILQVPETATNFEAAFQSGPTPRDAVITVTETFAVQPGTSVAAEPGQQFVILEFPDDVPPTLPEGDPRNGEEFDFDLSFDVPTPDPVAVKAMFTGKIEAGDQTFYIPLYPCVTDFSEIPAVEIPAASAPQFLTPQIADHINNSGDMTCNDRVYDFSDLSPANRLYLPAVRKP